MRGEVGKEIPKKERDNRHNIVTSHMKLSSALCLSNKNLIPPLMLIRFFLAILGENFKKFKRKITPPLPKKGSVVKLLLDPGNILYCEKSSLEKIPYRKLSTFIFNN